MDRHKELSGETGHLTWKGLCAGQQEEPGMESCSHKGPDIESLFKKKGGKQYTSCQRIPQTLKERLLEAPTGAPSRGFSASSRAEVLVPHLVPIQGQYCPESPSGRHTEMALRRRPRAPFPHNILPAKSPVDFGSKKLSEDQYQALGMALGIKNI